MHVPATLKKLLPLIVVIFLGGFLNMYLKTRSEESLSIQGAQASITGIMELEEPVEAPDFILTDLKGMPYRLSRLRGNVVLLNFWTTW